jgi:hypothetical protein
MVWHTFLFLGFFKFFPLIFVFFLGGLCFFFFLAFFFLVRIVVVFSFYRFRPGTASLSVVP